LYSINQNAKTAKIIILYDLYTACVPLLTMIEPTSVAPHTKAKPMLNGSMVLKTTHVKQLVIYSNERLL